jgi:hypothetical protein
VENQIDTEEVKFYINLLRKKNKFHITANYESTIAYLKKMIEKATNINRFFKEFQFQ